MNFKMAINSQLSTTVSKKQTKKKRSRIGTESYIWRSFGGLSAVGEVEIGGKGTGIKKHKLVDAK